MRLTIRHQTSYRYSKPIAYATQTLRLSPRAYEGLNVITWRVRGEGRFELPSFVDGYGNLVHCHTVNRTHDNAAVVVEGEVETRVTDGVVRGAAETFPPLFYLRSTRLTAADPAIVDLAQSCTGKSFDRLMALMETVRTRLDYRAGVTQSSTTAAEALRTGAGVCQDHAHLFIAGARALGVPARYVGGYLWAGSDSEDQASHAWAEAYIQDFGWVGFDPANRMRPTESYVRASIGLDYWSAAPVRGVRRGEGEESLAVNVKVKESAQQQQQQ
jgi:transglutaminase-like putative cysteine protease